MFCRAWARPSAPTDRPRRRCAAEPSGPPPAGGAAEVAGRQRHSGRSPGSRPTGAAGPGMSVRRQPLVAAAAVVAVQAGGHRLVRSRSRSRRRAATRCAASCPLFFYLVSCRFSSPSSSLSFSSSFSLSSSSSSWSLAAHRDDLELALRSQIGQGAPITTGSMRKVALCQLMASSTAPRDRLARPPTLAESGCRRSLRSAGQHSYGQLEAGPERPDSAGCNHT